MKEFTHVYLLSTKSYGHNGFIKVGVSSNYKERVRQISKNTPFPISLIAVVEDNDPLRLEAMVLDRFKDCRIKGEWFYVKPSIDIDCATCSHRDFMRDFNKQAKKLTSGIRDFLVSESSHGAV